jgi:hypothetical protein
VGLSVVVLCLCVCISAATGGRVSEVSRLYIPVAVRRAGSKVEFGGLILHAHRRCICLPWSQKYAALLSGCGFDQGAHAL